MQSLNGIRFSSLLVYTLGWLLLWEWIRPLSELADVGKIGIFVIFIALSLMMYALSIRSWWRWLILTFYMLWSIHYIYYPNASIVNGAWLTDVLAETGSSIRVLFEREWMEITNAFRTIMLFILLWMVTYLIHYWLMVRKRIFLFFFMTVILLTILDTFTAYSADYAIIRLFVIGFLLLGILRMERLLHSERLVLKPGYYRKWLIPFLLFLLVSGAIGFSSPKYSAQWDDPVPFFESTSEKFIGSGSKGTGKVGYDADDSRLGGGFSEDDSLVMTTKVQTRHYWKIETKHTYTGKGWDMNKGYDVRGSGIQTIEDMDIDPSVNRSDTQVGFLDLEMDANYVPYPNPIVDGVVIGNQDETVFTSDGDSNKIRSNGRTSFTYEYKTPIYNIDELKTIKQAPTSIVDSRYLQLPETLPARVKELAFTLTENEDNWYDKVKAIENHFDGAQFSYERTGIAYPDDNQDFVDQFLFETKLGYCDHYSTSMVVLVRSLGIPARWVKGFTHGTFSGREDGRNVYEVTNNNAHSWVEVFFPGVGWIPFEPTKGFTNNNRVEYNAGSDNSDSPEDATEREDQPAANTPDKPENNQSEQQPDTEKSIGESVKKAIVENDGKILFFFIMLILISGFVYMTRSKWIPRFWLLYFRREKSSDRMDKAYEVLLKQLGRYGIKRKPEQTLRDYSQYIDDYFSTQDMSRLTREYERVLYNGEDVGTYWKKSKVLWEKMMRKTIT